MMPVGLVLALSSVRVVDDVVVEGVIAVCAAHQGRLGRAGGAMAGAGSQTVRVSVE
jgi:hypothetical protein